MIDIRCLLILIIMFSACNKQAEKTTSNSDTNKKRHQKQKELVVVPVSKNYSRSPASYVPNDNLGPNFFGSFLLSNKLGSKYVALKNYFPETRESEALLEFSVMKFKVDKNEKEVKYFKLLKEEIAKSNLNLGESLKVLLERLPDKYSKTKIDIVDLIMNLEIAPQEKYELVLIARDSFYKLQKKFQKVDVNFLNKMNTSLMTQASLANLSKERLEKDIDVFLRTKRYHKTNKKHLLFQFRKIDKTAANKLYQKYLK